jgi:hypothetical protein
MSSQPQLPAAFSVVAALQSVDDVGAADPSDDNHELLQLDRRHACDTTGCIEARAPAQKRWFEQTSLTAL